MKPVVDFRLPQYLGYERQTSRLIVPYYTVQHVFCYYNEVYVCVYRLLNQDNKGSHSFCCISTRSSGSLALKL